MKRDGSDSHSRPAPTYKLDTSRIESRLEKLEGEFQRQTRELRRALDDVIAANATLAVVEKLIDAQAGAEHAAKQRVFLKQKQAQLGEDRQRIRERYGELQAELSDLQERAEQNVIGHIEPLMDYADKKIEECLKDSAGRMQQANLVDAPNAYRKHKQWLDDTVAQIRSKLEGLLAQRASFVTEVHQKQHQLPAGVSEAAPIDIPVYEVIAVDEEGNRKRAVVTLSDRRQVSDSGAVRFRLTPWNGASEFGQMLRDRIAAADARETVRATYDRVSEGIRSLVSGGMIANTFFAPFADSLADILRLDRTDRRHEPPMEG
jgi:hypothetical protein